MKLHHCSLLTAICLLTLHVNSAPAQQFDTPYVVARERNAEAWKAEDRAVEDKLAALRKKYNKPPNIIYVLSDDIGWGELGWQGGGKHRGLPTPNLDRMASIKQRSS